VTNEMFTRTWLLLLNITLYTSIHMKWTSTFGEISIVISFYDDVVFAFSIQRIPPHSTTLKLEMKNDRHFKPKNINLKP
jgi:hypothetical protein